MIIKRHTDLSEIPVSHKTSTITKKVYVINGSIPHITQVATATIKPHDQIPSHSHDDMYECYVIFQGNLDIRVDQQTFHLTCGDFICIEPPEYHSMFNVSDEDAIIYYWGVVSTANT